MAARRTDPARGAGRGFAALGRWIVRHPWYPVAFWIALLLVTAPFLPRLGSVTTNSTETVPTNAPSAVADDRLVALFPDATGRSYATLLLTGANLTDGYAQRLVMNLTTNLSDDRALTDIAGVQSVYRAYAEYLGGEVLLAGSVLGPALASFPSLPTAINESAALLWGPPALFLSTWNALLPNTSRSPAGWAPVAYQETAANLSGSSGSLAVLSLFYNGYAGATTGFNGTNGCTALAGSPSLIGCVDAAARANVAPEVTALVPPAVDGIANATLRGLGVENATPPVPFAEVQAVGAAYLAAGSGLPSGFLRTVWTGFPAGLVTPAAADAYANGSVQNATLATELLPVPVSIRSQFVAPDARAMVITVAFSVGTDYRTASGETPVYDDLSKIDARAASVVRLSDPQDRIAYAMTGPSPLNLLTQQVIDASLMAVLPLTVGLLLAIAMLYFRSPVTPIVTFAGLGIALLLGLGATVLIGSVVEHVDTSALTLEEVFVLGVGTDYSIFLVARYREELVQGRSSDEAIVTSVQWAGQSIATSGSTAILVTAALAASGVALLSQWGLVLSVAVLITMLLSLTLIPAFLRLIGPRIFWPYSGERFRHQAQKVADRMRRRDTYFYRAGRLSQRRAGGVVGLLLLVSVPLIVVAVNVPVSFDFYGQLPGGHPATDGLSALGTAFGPGFATPSFALVTFASPLVVGTHSNATEFVDLEALTSLANRTDGIAAVRSPIGPDGAPLSTWLDLSGQTIANRTALLGVLQQFVGTDGRTVLLTLQTNATGLSGAAVGAVESVSSAFSGFAATHAEVTAVAFGGGAPIIHDLATETDTATVLMLVAVAIGLVVVLLAVLRSWIIALMAVGTIGLSIGWAWALSYAVFDQLLGFPLFFYVRTILIMLVLGLGIDYNIFVLTRVREERLRGRPSGEAAVEAVGRTGGIITAAAVILACAFAALLVGEFTLIRAIGFSVAVAVVLDAMVVRTYFVPSALHLLGDRVWSLSGRAPKRTVPEGADPTGPTTGSGPTG